MSNSTESDTRPVGSSEPPRRGAGRGGRSRRWPVVVLLVLLGVVAFLFVDRVTEVDEPPLDPPVVVPPPEPLPEPEVAEPPVVDRLLYDRDSIARYRASMATPAAGPYFATGDAGHGGEHSPGDGERAVELAREFVDDPRASYWRQPQLPFSSGDPYPRGMDHARPMHAAWVYMTRPDDPGRDELAVEIKRFLLTHAIDPSLDFSDSRLYGVEFPGFAASPIFGLAQWMTRMVKTRDMLGRELFDDEENERFDQWIFGYANWSAKWLHLEVYGSQLPGRLERDYAEVGWSANASRASYDGGPPIGAAGMAYTNRHAAVASAMSLAANYVKHYGHPGTTISEPDYGVWSVDEVVDHSRLFFEETLRFSVWPQGFQGDFERGDADHHDASAQQGWLYSINVLANLVEMAEYHAKRGDLSLWEYGTTAGHDGSEGAPEADGFDQKTLHFLAWSMTRYVNDGWGRTNRGEPLALPSFYHDVIPAAAAHRFAPDDPLLEAAWRREGRGFPAYPGDPQSQGPFPAQHGEGAKMIGLIEHALGSAILEAG